MFKYWKFYLLNRLVSDPIVASQIYHMLYNGGQPPRIDYKVDLSNFSSPSVPSHSAIKVETSSKKKEMIEALSFLKSKSNKTKQDRESMGVLEAALKNL